MNKALDAILDKHYHALLLDLHVGYSQKDFTREEAHKYILNYAILTHEQFETDADQIEVGEDGIQSMA